MSNKIFKIFISGLMLLLLGLILLVSTPTETKSWGFYVHRKVNRMAVFTLPPEMIGFFKKHIEYISEHAIDPDKRSHAVKGEAEKHYIDIDIYGPSPFDSVPMRWKDAVNKYTEDTLRKHGILPWNIETMQYRLTQAFKEEDLDMILYCVSNIGHYIADATVPLHTTHYYNGKTPMQKGIHALWETRIPEITSDNYDFFVGRATYISKPLQFAWNQVKATHALVDTIYNVYDRLEQKFPADMKYSYETRGANTIKVYSYEYSIAFAKEMDGMVEKQMRKAIHAVGSFWYTAWVNAGQPDLSRLMDKEISEKIKKEQKEIDEMWKTGKPPIGRENPD